MADDQNTQVRMGDLQLEGMPSWNQQDFGSGDTNSLTSPSGFDVSIASPPALDASPNGPTTIGADGIPRYANGEPISKRTLQNRRSQKEFRLRRANYLKELEEKCRRYESEESLVSSSQLPFLAKLPAGEPSPAQRGHPVKRRERLFALTTSATSRRSQRCPHGPSCSNWSAPTLFLFQ
jgi:hypothetical protein